MRLIELNNEVNLQQPISKNQSENIPVTIADRNSVLSADEAYNHLINKYPGKMLFSLNDVATEIGITYEFIRNATETGKISCLKYGTRKMITIKEFARILTEGVK